MRILFDTNVVVRAINRPGGPAAAAIQKALAANHLPIASTFLLNEIARVLAYPRVKALAKNTEAEQQAALEIFQAASATIDPDATPSVSRDPDDDPIIALALAAGVEVLCSLDRHFRTKTVIELLQAHGIRVLTDVELLVELDSASSRG